MKKIILVLFLLSLASKSVYSQQVPNGSFENWSSRPTWGFLPTSWYGTNYVDLNYVGVTRESDNPVDGAYYVKLTGKSQVFFGETFKAPGGLTLSDLYHATNVAEFKEGKPKAGVPYTERPARFTGYYKYLSINGDSYYMSIALTKWRGTSRDTIGFAEKRSNQSVSSWTRFEMPIEYRSQDTPDTLNIVLLTTPVFNRNDLSKVQVGSTLSVDKLEFIMQDFFKVDFSYTGNPCTGSTLVFNATSENVPGDSWEWKVNGTSVGTGPSLTYTFPEVETQVNFNVTLRGTNNKIGSDELTKVITIHPKPNIQLLPKDPSICPRSSITLRATGGVSYQWNTAGSGSQITVTPQAYALYEVTGTDQYGCTNSASSMIFYHNLDTTTVTAQFCSNEKYQFFNRELTAAGTYFHNLPSVKTGCDSTIRLVLTTKPVPVATLTSDKNAVCAGTSAVLTATPGFAGYNWGNGFVASNTLAVQPVSNQNYSVIVKSENGCSVTLTKEILILPNSITNRTIKICQGDSVNVFGEWKKAEGTFQKTFVSKNGCDSVSIINVSVNPLPNQFAIEGSGGYSPDKEGRRIILAGSETGIVYDLLKDGQLVKSLTGNGDELSFGIHPAGKYVINAKNTATGCYRLMKDTVIITLLVGIDQFAAASKNYLYPNPASEKIYFSSQPEGGIRIFNTQGRIVLQIEDIKKEYIDIQNLSPGLYIVEMNKKGSSEFIRFVKR